jgi:hypothetical protein
MYQFPPYREPEWISWRLWNLIQRHAMGQYSDEDIAFLLDQYK